MTYAIDIAHCNATKAVKDLFTALAADLVGVAGGDLGGFFPNPSVLKINGVALGSTAAGSGNILIGSGTAWVSNAVSGDITIGSTGITAIGASKVTNTMLAGSIDPSKVTVASASIIIGNVSNVGAAVAVTGDITVTNAGVTAIGANKVLDTMIRQSAGLSIIGRSANTTGNVADITAASDFQVMRRSGTTIAFGSVNLASANAVAGVLPNGNTTATDANTNSAIVSRDGSGNFTAGTITANLTGTASIATVANTVSTANEATDTTCFPLFVTASGTQSLQPKNNNGFAYNSNINALTLTTFIGALTGNADTATKLATARNIGGVSFDGSANITVATATGGFTVSGGALAVGANDITCTGSLGATASRLTKGWFTDLQVTNAIAGSVTGNAATVTTNANSTGAITSVGNATSLGSFTSAQLLAALTDETGTGAAVFATSPTFVTPLLGTPTSGVLTNCSGTAASLTAGNATTLANARTIGGVSFNGSANITVATATGGFNVTGGSLGVNTSSPGFTLECVGSIAATIAGAAISQKQMVMSYDSANDWGTITAIHQGTAFTPIQLNGQCVYIMNGSAPATPTGQYAIYSLSGALKGKGTSGTVTNIGNAEPHCDKCGADFGVGWENPLYGGQMIVCKVCENEYLDNLRKCLNYLVTNDRDGLVEMADFLSKDASHVRWNIDRDDEYKNVKIPLEIGVKMVENIT